MCRRIRSNLRNTSFRLVIVLSDSLGLNNRQKGKDLSSMPRKISSTFTKEN